MTLSTNFDKLKKVSLRTQRRTTMFISYGMFIFLILLTMIMIALIIYLTMTAKGPNKPSKTTENAPVSSVPATESIHSLDSSSLEKIDETNSVDSFYKDQDYFFSSQEQQIHDQFQSNLTDHSVMDSTTQSEQSSEDDQLFVLPYPKEDVDDQEIYSTSIFKRASATKDETSYAKESDQSTKYD